MEWKRVLHLNYYNVPFIVSGFSSTVIIKRWLAFTKRKENILLEVKNLDYQVDFYLISIINHYWANLTAARV